MGAAGEEATVVTSLACSLLTAVVTAGASRHIASSVACALLRLSANLLLGKVSEEMSGGSDDSASVAEELSARLDLIAPVIAEKVKAGRAGREPSISGDARALRNCAEHEGLGSGANHLPRDGRQAKRRQRGGRKKEARTDFNEGSVGSLQPAGLAQTTRGTTAASTVFFDIASTLGEDDSLCADPLEQVMDTSGPSGIAQDITLPIIESQKWCDMMSSEGEGVEEDGTDNEAKERHAGASLCIKGQPLLTAEKIAANAAEQKAAKDTDGDGSGDDDVLSDSDCNKVQALATLCGMLMKKKGEWGTERAAHEAIKMAINRKAIKREEWELGGLKQLVVSIVDNKADDGG
jgi:hypothetical protein